MRIALIISQAGLFWMMHNGLNQGFVVEAGPALSFINRSTNSVRPE